MDTNHGHADAVPVLCQFGWLCNCGCALKKTHTERSGCEAGALQEPDSGAAGARRLGKRLGTEAHARRLGRPERTEKALLDRLTR